MYDSIPVKILVTAFEPFGKETRNSSLETLRNLPKIPGMEITKLEVPVVFGTAEQTVLEKLHTGSYDAVMMLGEAGGRSAITPELKAVNLDDARIPDNAGN
ncbi:MAG: peptidase C15, partial [Erysipelotrichales bacterium]|nr:peptidase C15 [Erysipelotrichales bacterium]